MNSHRVGILGGGQLGLMLADAACRLGKRPTLLVESAEAPAARIHSQLVRLPDPGIGDGSLEVEKALSRFFSRADRIIFENEFVDCAQLEGIARGREIQFAPGLDVILKFQDKLEQKKILNTLKIPTADFFVLDEKQAIEPQILEALRKWEGGCVLKWARMGYDGKGVLVVEGSPPDFEAVRSFCEEARRKGSSLYVERRITFKQELAMVSAYSVTGEFLAYPLVISEQRKGICARVKGPATKLGVSEKCEALAQEYAERLAKSSRLVGVFALEFFETETGELLVNEIAPRVHNSGHYTQNACLTDQFENHWRAVLGMPLGKVLCRPYFGMFNLLGPDLSIPSEASSILPEINSRVFLHWYHKIEIRPGRKVGHLNGVAESAADLEVLLSEFETIEKEWVARLARGLGH